MKTSSIIYPNTNGNNDSDSDTRLSQKNVGVGMDKPNEIRQRDSIQAYKSLFENQSPNLNIKDLEYRKTNNDIEETQSVNATSVNKDMGESGEGKTEQSADSQPWERSEKAKIKRLNYERARDALLQKHRETNVAAVHKQKVVDHKVVNVSNMRQVMMQKRKDRLANPENRESSLKSENAEFIDNIQTGREDKGNDERDNHNKVHLRRKKISTAGVKVGKNIALTSKKTYEVTKKVGKEGFSVIGEIITFISEGDVIARFAIALIAGIVVFGIIFTQMGFI